MFNALSDFLIYCRVERHLADLTCKAYERDVRACLEFLRSQGIAALAEVRTRELRAFLADVATRRPAPASQARTVAALRGFFRFCVQSDYIERDPAHVLSTPKKREALPDVLDRAELGRLLEVPGKRGVWQRQHGGKAERDRLLLALFAYGGLRRSELLGLDCDDVDLERRLISAIPFHEAHPTRAIAHAKYTKFRTDPAATARGRPHVDEPSVWRAGRVWLVAANHAGGLREGRSSMRSLATANKSTNATLLRRDHP